MSTKKRPKTKLRKLPFLGLVMIVKNESHIIKEALASIVAYLDYYVISDTGSTDDTPAVIRSFFEAHGVPGEIFHDAWSDFGTNRSLVLTHAMGRMQFAVMLDADDIVRMPEETDVRRLLDESYDGFKIGIVDDDEALFYWRTQIFHLKTKWRYEGVLHEYPALVHSRPPHLKELPIKVVSRRLGSRNLMDVKDKYRNDAEMLLRGLDKEPLNTRYMFYLAQSFRDCLEYGKAVEWYEKRADFGGWYEEVFYSLYMIGKLYMFHLHNERLGIQYSLKAFATHPKRVESINTLVQYYKTQRNYRMAYTYVQKVKDVPYPTEDGLFLEKELYTTVLKLDNVLLSFLCFDFAEFDTVIPTAKSIQSPPLACFDDLVSLRAIPSVFVKRSSVLPFPKTHIPMNPNPLNEKHRAYRVFNPSVARKTGTDELWVNIRCSNFDVNYLPTDKDGMIRTENFLAPLDLSRIYRWVDKSSFFDRYRQDTRARILGYEDVRLFWFNDRWCFLANNDEIHGFVNSPQMVFGRLAEHPNDATMTWDIEYVVHLQCPCQQTTEKNWVPLLRDDTTSPHGELEIVYSCHPLKILVADIVTGFCFVKHELHWSALLPFPQSYTIRNSTPFIPFRNGWLGLGHVVYFLEDYGYQRIYYSILVWISQACDNLRISNFFHMEDHLIEFANGIVRTPANTIQISYSLSDSIPKMTCEMTEDDIERMLIPK